MVVLRLLRSKTRSVRGSSAVTASGARTLSAGSDQMISPPLMACRLLPLHQKFMLSRARRLSTSPEGEIEMRVSRHPLYPASSIQFIHRPHV